MLLRKRNRVATMLTRALALCIVLVAASRPASACSLATIDPVDGFVFYGEVLAHVEAPFRGGSTFGIEIAPRVEFRVPQRTPSGTYEVYPFGLRGDCTSEATTASDIAARFAVGSIVGVIGVVPEHSPMPGDIEVGSSVLFALEPGCALAELRSRRYDYEEYKVPCGNYRFEANKDVALLETAPPAERSEILARLAKYQGYVRFLDLLAKYAPDVATGRRLLDLRYPEIASLSCLATRQELEPLEWQRRERWGEYCMQDDPYDSLPPDTWHLYDAIAHNRIDVVEDFLDQGGDPNEPLRGTPMGSVPSLRVAVPARNEEIVLALLRAGANFEQSGLDPWSVSSTGMARAWDFLLTQWPARLPIALETMGSACRGGYYEVVDVLTRHARERGVAIKWRDGIVADCLTTSPDTARLLIERGAPITRSALSAAAMYGSIGMLRHLLERGADPFERYRASGGVGGGTDGFAPIDFVLRSWGQADEPTRQRFRYMLHELAAGPPPKNGEHVEHLVRNVDADLAAYADPAARLAFAARFGLYDEVEKMLAESDAFTPAMLRDAVRAALEGRNPDVARLLLASGAPVGGGTLRIAAELGPAGLVKHLIALGADVDERVDGVSPLEGWLASERRDDEVVQVLVAARANVCDVVSKVEPDFMARGTVLRGATDCPP